MAFASGKAITLMCLLAGGHALALHKLAFNVTADLDRDEAFADMADYTADEGEWKLIFRQSAADSKIEVADWQKGPKCDSDKGEACSNLAGLSNFVQPEGDFWLKLTYRVNDPSQDAYDKAMMTKESRLALVWKQSKSPLGTDPGTYTAMKPQSTLEEDPFFKGLKSNGVQCVMDGGRGDIPWYAVGKLGGMDAKLEEMDKGMDKGKLPGPRGEFVKEVRLYTKCRKIKYTEWEVTSACQKTTGDVCKEKFGRKLVGKIDKDPCGISQKQPVKMTRPCACPLEGEALVARTEKKKTWTSKVMKQVKGNPDSDELKAIIAELEEALQEDPDYTAEVAAGKCAMTEWKAGQCQPRAEGKGCTLTKTRKPVAKNLEKGSCKLPYTRILWPCDCYEVPTWKLIFRQFGMDKTKTKPDDWLTPVPCTQGRQRSCSELGNLQSYKQGDTGYKLQLKWPGLGAQEWTQSMTPQPMAVGGKTTVPGFTMAKEKALSEEDERQFGGLEQNGGENCLWDGAVGTREWWYAVGSVKGFGKDKAMIPGPYRKAVKVVELYTECKKIVYSPWEADKCEDKETFNKCFKKMTRTADAEVDNCGNKAEALKKTVSCKCPDAEANLRHEKHQRQAAEVTARAEAKTLAARQGVQPGTLLDKQTEIVKATENTDATEATKYEAKDYCKQDDTSEYTVVGKWKAWGKCREVLRGTPTNGCIKTRRRDVDTEVLCGLRIREQTVACECPEELFAVFLQGMKDEEKKEVEEMVKAQDPTASPEALRKKMDDAEAAMYPADGSTKWCPMTPWTQATQCHPYSKEHKTFCVVKETRVQVGEDPTCTERTTRRAVPCLCPCEDPEYGPWEVDNTTLEGGACKPLPGTDVTQGCVKHEVREILANPDDRAICNSRHLLARITQCKCPQTLIDLKASKLEEAKEEAVEVFFDSKKKGTVKPLEVKGQKAGMLKAQDDEDVATKQYVESWRLIFRQTGRNRQVTTADDWLKHVDCLESSIHCSELRKAANWKSIGNSYHLKLSWPKDEGVEDQEWVQAELPSKPYLYKDTGAQAPGYRATRHTNHDVEGWGGLEYNGLQSLWDGSYGVPNWWYAVGSVANYKEKGVTGIPGPGKVVQQVDLYVKVLELVKCQVQPWKAWSTCDPLFPHELDRGCTMTREREPAPNCPKLAVTQTVPCICPVIRILRKGMLPQVDLEYEEAKNGGPLTDEQREVLGKEAKKAEENKEPAFPEAHAELTKEAKAENVSNMARRTVRAMTRAKGTVKRALRTLGKRLRRTVRRGVRGFSKTLRE